MTMKNDLLMYTVFRMRRKIYSYIRNIKIRHKNFNNEQERELYEKLDEHIIEMYRIAAKLKPSSTEECFDRYYIDDYVEKNKRFIKGDVLEWAGGEICYSKKHGSNDCNIYIASGIEQAKKWSADYLFDLDDKDSLPPKKFDCIVCTQVLMYVINPLTALRNIKSMLKPNGVLILTVPGVCFHIDKKSPHTYQYTERSLKSMFTEAFGKYMNFEYYGNLRYAIYMLFWVKRNPFVFPNDHNPRFPLVYGITAQNDDDITVDI